MSVLRLVLGDQLSRSVASLSDLDMSSDVVLMVEAAEESVYVRHHRQKIVLFLAAMRHFAAELLSEGVQVDYVGLDDPANTGSIVGEVERALARHACSKVVLAEPGEWRLRAAIEKWGQHSGVPVEIRVDDRFFASPARFRRWAARRTVWRMEHYYREMRREHSILMEGEGPAGGAWNYDAENRRRLQADVAVPVRRRFAPDSITREVMELVEARFPDHFGDLEGFAWPVTRRQALEALGDFLEHGLPSFGDYQDAMKEGAPFLYHSLLSPALNLGLLSPREVCAAAEEAWRRGRAPLNAVEGFVRQVLGWREYVRGVYWTLMPDYAESNALGATRPLPGFYWTGDTPMRCLAEAVGATRRHAYSHHIQRLMLTGNFALLAGIAPREIERWYLAVYADAVEWVEMPNTLGMAVFADGGRMASKPYAASGAYIDRMSDFCRSCAFDVKRKLGSRACPFNYLYWAFLIRNRSRLEKNPRMAMPYRNLARWTRDRQQEYVDQADQFLRHLQVGARE